MAKTCPPQLDGNNKVLFLAKVPSVGYAVYDVEPEKSPKTSPSSTLKVTETSLENARYRLQLDSNGDVSSIFDKSVNKELLSAPIRLSIRTDNPPSWPAWNMDYRQQMAEAKGYVEGPAKIRIAENGPARVAVEVDRQFGDSTFAQTIRLSAGDGGNRLEFANVIDWKTTSANLTAVFPLSASNAVATYNWDVGTIERPNDEPRNYEKPSHQWVDLTDKGGAFGATMLTDCKTGSDKPDDNTLRLTLIRTPGARSYTDQASQDLGHHEIVYGLAGHAGDWRKEQTDWQGERLNQPLIAFASLRATGGNWVRHFRMVKLDNSRVRVSGAQKGRGERRGDCPCVVEMEGKTAKGCSSYLRRREVVAAAGSQRPGAAVVR